MTLKFYDDENLTSNTVKYGIEVQDVDEQLLMMLIKQIEFSNNQTAIIMRLLVEHVVNCKCNQSESVMQEANNVSQSLFKQEKDVNWFNFILVKLINFFQIFKWK